MRTFGVEEELLLVDEATGLTRPVAQQVLAVPAAVRRSGCDLTAEVHQEIVEVVTRPHTDALELAREAWAGRADADAAAQQVGARAAALASSPLPVVPHPTPTPRYLRMMTRFGALARRSLVCGLHVHVGVESPEEGVGVLDRIRTWLPVLLALSANSPFSDGEDTCYASWRTIVWTQWPNSGPNPVFGDLAAYRAYEDRLLAAGLLLDPAMLYNEVRLSRRYPTVEVRVADVPIDATVTATIAALIRGLVDTAAAQWRRGEAPPAVPETGVRIAAWQAALSGVRGPLVDPATGEAATAEAVVAALLAHVLPALERAGDDRLVLPTVGAILGVGTGADVQRAAVAERSDVADAVRAAIRGTHAPARVG
jgi:glutamate---cysteine ligase / carboxylate-amine ligase